MTEPVPQSDLPVPHHREKTISINLFFITMAVTALIGFAAGTRAQELYALAAPLFGVKASSDTLDLALVQRTYQELKVNYNGQLDSSTLVDGAARGMVAAAGDRYTVFMDKKEAEEFNKELSGEVTGIGCELSVRNDQPTAVRVLEGSPAQQAGIMAGDVFVSVNDDSVVGADSSTVASKIRGEAGTTVKVVVMRGVDTKSFTITRAKLNDVSVRATVQDGVGIMTITRFDQDSGDLARKAAQDFKTQGVRGVIVDLRDNGGGYVTAAQAVGGLWLDDKLLFTTKDSAGNSQNVSTNGGGPILAGIKTVVLVNGGTASASEIVAGALQEYELAMVIGEKTFGKGTEQQVIDLPDGRKLKVTIARWYTPKGKNITKEGIAPTTTVSLGTDDVNAGRDPQMDAAKAAVAK